MISVYTVGEKCKKCYSCVRVCPTKAIEVHSGQAHIIEEKCISCGLCVSMCTQGAKQIVSSTAKVLDILDSDPAAVRYALVAPSFPAAFLDLKPEKLVGALKRLGFRGVFEVAFGADLVSYRYMRKYKELIQGASQGGESSFIISTPCPAVVSYVEKMFPELVPYLADIMSPMEATARMIREKMEADAKIVFIGPCVAKKEEAGRLNLVDEVLTFAELKSLFEIKGIDPESVEAEDFDPPRANLGRIYPVTGGLLKAASIDNDLLDSPVLIIEGPDRVSDILTVISRRVSRNLPVVNRFFDLLLCEGCIGGPVMTNDLTFYERKKYIVKYMKQRPLIEDIEQWAEEHKEYLDIDLSKSFSRSPHKEEIVPEAEIKRILALTNKFSPEDELNCRACGYASCREKAIAVYRGIAEVEMCLPFMITQLECAIGDLKDNQHKLVQAEKLASMGQMAAGIAHEINNPLGVVLMYSHILKGELEQGGQAKEDVDKIIEEAERTRKIVRGILNFARQEKIERAPADINRIVKDAADQVGSPDDTGNIKVLLDLDKSIGRQLVDKIQLRQVFDNLLKNAVEAMPGGGEIAITTRLETDDFIISIKDSGQGIAEENISKLFSPFFTTKPVGKGTGLGLPVCYGIVKMHGGSIQAENNKEGGAVFTVKINRLTMEGQVA